MNYQEKEVIFKVENLNISYGPTKIIHDVNMEIKNIVRPDTGKPQGQIRSIIGQSGCGKSTLFEALAGFRDLTEEGCSGSVFTGNDLHPIRMGEMGVIPQTYPLLGHRTIRGNLMLALRGEKSPEKIIKDYTEHFGLNQHLDKYPKELSGGQRQRVAILQQILAGNQTILADEPFSGLDALMKDKVIDFLIKASNIAEENTIIIVSHDIESACAISDHAYVIGSDGINPGSTILKTYDFLEMGLAYHDDVQDIPEFRRVIKEIKSIM